MTLGDVAIHFIFEEVSEPEEITDEDTEFSPWDLKIEFIPRNLIQFTLTDLFLFYFSWFMGGGAFMTNIP